ncbi:hypothetical protein [Janthinobacterium sp. SUN137]|uniref:gp53-like domain-containing protein n=1 Tax=Janthinobacterium sp. SUN137 TaxID=3014789 RepID=UPI002713239A|nr:hypothetical protein [Janthinobacterium sp. SUN137]MDO8039516.1 hypothetical protein [Janthinobacterium sp. SUN137]
MKRQIIYPGQIPLETDLLGTNKNMMIALAKLTATIIGTATMVSGLACVPNSPAALSVVIAPGEIYSMQNIDGTAYSSIAADTIHSIMKQGLSLDPVTLACAAPGTAGQSINYLIQAAYSEVDSGAVVLPYYNASNPSTAYSGPGGAGTTNNTVRDGTVALSAKAGIAAATGSQLTPAADVGYVGLWIVTVANGQSTITAGNIAKATGAPFSGTVAMLNMMNAFTVSPTVPTPPKFDASPKVATAEFVQQSQGNIIGHDVVGVARSLTPDDIGKALYFSAPNLIFTLPKPSDLGLSTNSGKCIHFFGFGGNTAKIVPGAGAGISFNVGTVPFIEFKPGQYLTLTAASDIVWQVIDSTAEMWRNADFAAMVSSSGYQRLPGGLIFQVGGGAQTPASGYVDVIFPIPFPNECTHVFPGYEGQGGSGSSMPTIVNAGMKTRTGCRLYTYNGNALSGGITPSYLAFGD